MKSSLKQDQARKRNFAKFRLTGMYDLITGLYRQNSVPLLLEEKTKLNIMRVNLQLLLKEWDLNYIEFKRRKEIERET